MTAERILGLRPPTAESILCAVLPLLLGATALAAYNLSDVPIQWIAQALLASLGVLVLLVAKRLPGTRATLVFAVFVGWSGVVFIVNLPREMQMPATATLPYWAFVLLRYVSLLAFAAAFYLSLWLCRRGWADPLLNRVVWVGLIIAGVTLYIHAAHWFGLPEPSRNRLGTAGGAQALTFTSGDLLYRRALGTFREPTHLAEWMLLPLFASLARGGRLGALGAALSACAIVFSVSLTGLLSAAAGFIGGLWVMEPLRRRNIQRLLVAVAGAGLIGLILSQVMVGTGSEVLSLSAVIWRRFQDLAAGGIGGSSRSIWTELLTDGVPIIGYGFGNANIVASARLGSELIVSYVSLYINVLYSTGVVGLTLLGIFLMQPIVGFRGHATRRLQAFLMAYIASLVAFMAGSEELSAGFGFVTGFLHYHREHAASVGLIEDDRAGACAAHLSV